jgi:hypothetical protein
MYIASAKMSTVYFFWEFLNLFVTAACSQSHNGGSFSQKGEEKVIVDVVMMKMKWRMRDDR